MNNFSARCRWPGKVGHVALNPTYKAARRAPLNVRCSTPAHASSRDNSPQPSLPPNTALKQLAVAGATMACGLCVAKLILGTHRPALANPEHQAPTASITYAPSPSPGSWLRYKSMQVFTLPVYGKLLAMVAVGVPMVVIGAGAYRRITGSNWGEAVTKTYYVLNNVPGADLTAEDSPNAALMLNVVHVLSLFTFAILVGVLTEEIQSGVEAVRAGNFPLPEAGHTVLLGWGPRTPTVLREILEARRERGDGCGLRLPVVLLGGEASKEDMDATLLNAGFGEVLGTQLITRHGSPTRPADLDRVAAGRASTVIWMVPPGEAGGSSEDGEGSGDGEEGGDGWLNLSGSKKAVSEKAAPGGIGRAGALSASLAALHAVADPTTQRGIVIVQADASLAGWEASPGGRTVAHLLAARGRTITTLAELSNLDNILAQSALTPGVSSVFEKICLQGEGGVEFYTRSYPELAGCSFRTVRRAFPDATACGVVDSVTGRAQLTPADDLVLGPLDGIVLLASDSRHTQLSRGALAAEVAAEAAARSSGSASNGVSASSSIKSKNSGSAKVASRSAHVVILAPGGGGTETLVDSLCEYAPRGSLITLVTPVWEGSAGSAATEGAPLRTGPGAGKGIRLRVVRDDPSLTSALRGAAVTRADAVILAPPSGWSTGDEDAQVISTALALRGLLEEQPHSAVSGSSTAPSATAAGQPTHGQPHHHNSSVAPPLNFVCCVREEQSRAVLRELVAPAPPPSALPSESAVLPRRLSLDVVLADDLLSGMLTQVAAEPLLRDVFADLCSEEGAELYVRGPASYGLAVGQQLKWCEVQEAVRVSKAVAIGYLDRWGDVVLALPADAVVTLQAGERLVVIADD